MEQLLNVPSVDGKAEIARNVFRLEKKLNIFISNNPWTTQKRDSRYIGDGRHRVARTEDFFNNIFATQLQLIDKIPDSLGIELGRQEWYFLPFDRRNRGSLKRGTLYGSYTSPYTERKRIVLIYPLPDSHFMGHFFEQDTDLVWHDAGGDHGLPAQSPGII